MNFEKLKDKFDEFNKRFFKNTLVDVKLEFSDNMKNSAGIFYPPHKQKTFGRIRLNRPMLSLRSDKERMETLLHEMTHASLHHEGNILGKPVKPHGKEFLKKIKELNKALSINITTKHRFMSWYRCDGKCSTNELCLYGYVSRACNKTISDLAMHKSHQMTCGGTFREAEEPAKNLLKVITKRYKEIKKTQKKSKQEEVSQTGAVLKFLNNRKSIDYITDDEA